MPIYMSYEGIHGPVMGRYGLDRAGIVRLWTRSVSSGFRPGSNKGRGNQTALEIVASKSVDCSSGLLFPESLHGEGKKVTIEFVNGNEAPYMKLEMENTLILNYAVSTNRERPFESFSLNLTRSSYSSAPAASSTSLTAPARDLAKLSQ